MQVQASSQIRRRAAECLGRGAEDLVAALWEDEGYKILARRLRTGAGEIDLVMANEGQLIFVEVKARENFTAAAYAISPRQQVRLLEAASLALANHPQWARLATRFDVALVCHGRVKHIRDAIRYN